MTSEGRGILSPVRLPVPPLQPLMRRTQRTTVAPEAGFQNTGFSAAGSNRAASSPRKEIAGRGTLQARGVGVPRRSYPLSEVYRLLEPGPVILLTTAGKKRANIMPQSWHMMIEFEPPMVACVVSNRNFTFKNLKATKECAINIPTVELAEKVVACGNSSGRDVDKFETIGLTPVAASRVQAPLIAECYANLECRVVDTREVNRYCLFVLEVLKAWIDPAKKRPRTIHHMGRGTFMVSGKTIKLRSGKK